MFQNTTTFQKLCSISKSCFLRRKITKNMPPPVYFGYLCLNFIFQIKIYHILFFMLKIAHSPIYRYKLPDTHRFPMEKYELIAEQLVYEGIISESNFFHPQKLSTEKITRTHDPDYWQSVRNLELTEKEIRKIGFPMSENFVERCITIGQGTLECAYFALQHGVAMNTAGGTHHAFTNRGEGFCLLNDAAMAANILLDEGKINRVLILDLDVHQGNGTAEIFRNEPRVFTFSMHGEKNYPHQKEKSDLDIGLENETQDKFYLETLYENFNKILDTHQPDFIFFNAGVDILTTDKLGKLNVSPDGCRRRDKMVFEICKKNNIPVTVCMGGGYSERLRDIVDAHANTFRMAQEVFF